jgi:hypothetical protein
MFDSKSTQNTAKLSPVEDDRQGTAQEAGLALEGGEHRGREVFVQT